MCTWPWAWAYIAGENPNSSPPAAAAQWLGTQRRMARYPHQADSPRAAMLTRLKVNTGPRVSVSGASRTPGSTSEVFHSTLTPSGAFSQVVTNGFSPCSIA
jgi:hypothetical protein